MGKFIDLTGKRFGRLLVISKFKDKKYNKIQWKCQCDCGNTCIVLGSSLRNGLTKSCGCLHKDIVRQNMSKNKKQNTYDLTNSYGIMYDTHMNKILFDIEDYNIIKDYYWTLNERRYVISFSKGKRTLLHRLIMNAPNNMVVDHINHNVTDNRKCNLRICSQKNNTWNRNVRKDNACGITGVHYDNKRHKFVAQMQCEEYKKWAEFNKLEDAISQRKIWEQDYFKEFQNGFISQ